MTGICGGGKEELGGGGSAEWAELCKLRGGNIGVGAGLNGEGGVMGKGAWLCGA